MKASRVIGSDIHDDMFLRCLGRIEASKVVGVNEGYVIFLALILAVMLGIPST